MALFLFFTAIIIFLAVLLNKISEKLGVPMLLAFIALGMIFGSDGIFKISFDNFIFSEQLCSVALIFIMFYGGFGTKWSVARPVAVTSFLLSSIGVAFTTAFTALFCYFVLRVPFAESFLIGAVISSTDAASVFSILRSKKLNLRDNTASLLEVESGSNDPMAYMLTIIALSLLGQSNGQEVKGLQFLYLIFAQIVYGIIFGFLIGYIAFLVLKRFNFSVAGFDTTFIMGIAVISYALPSILGGNGFLSVYLSGLFLGNKTIANKKSLVNFFDGITGLMQIALFFILGLLSWPSRILTVALPALAIALFLTLIARPLAVFLIMMWRGHSIKQQLLVSAAGLRGAASIVFAVMAVTATGGVDSGILKHDIFHIVFFIVLFSIFFQGTFLAWISRKLNMIDNTTNVLHTFNDYSDETPISFIQVTVPESHAWNGQEVKSIVLPPETLLVLILHEGERKIPRGGTRIKAGDVLVLAAQIFSGQTVHSANLPESKSVQEKNVSIQKRLKNKATIQAKKIFSKQNFFSSAEPFISCALVETQITNNHEWINKTLAEIGKLEAEAALDNVGQTTSFVVLVKRKGKLIIPTGNTRLLEGDIIAIEHETV